MHDGRQPIAMLSNQLRRPKNRQHTNDQKSSLEVIGGLKKKKKPL